MKIDLNCDLGEGVGNDEAIMPFITSANIACGFHAGDEKTMRETIRLAKNLMSISVRTQVGRIEKILVEKK